MDGNHPQNKDPRPKRRKDKHNPYNIFSTGRNTEQPHFYVSFQDAQGINHCLEINHELFELFDMFELEDLSFLNEMDNHYEHSELTEISLNARSIVNQESIDELVAKRIQTQNLHIAIAQLPEIQRRRLIMYYFDGLTYQQIADIEGCIHQAVAKSIKAAEKNIKDILSNMSNQ